MEDLWLGRLTFPSSDNALGCGRESTICALVWKSTTFPRLSFFTKTSRHLFSVKIRSIKFSRSFGSWRRPSSSTGSRGKCSINILANIPTPFFDRHSLFIIDPDPLHPTTRGITFENKPTKTLLFQAPRHVSWPT